LDLSVLLKNLGVVFGSALNSSDDSQRLLGAVVSCKPSRGFRDHKDEYKERDDEDRLKRNGNSPGLSPGHRRESVSDPIGKEDSTVEQTKLETDKPPTGAFR